jgi:hypothetical protein
MGAVARLAPQGPCALPAPLLPAPLQRLRMPLPVMVMHVQGGGGGFGGVVGGCCHLYIPATWGRAGPRNPESN